MGPLFTRHRALLDKAVAALGDRGFWTPFPEVPSGKIYGETASEDGLAASRHNSAPPSSSRITPNRAGSAPRSRPGGRRSASPIRRRTPGR